MAIPIVSCSTDIIYDYSASPRTVQLSATAINSPTSWVWNIKSVPTGSTANIGIKGDFTDSVAVIQNPQIIIDGGVDGGYCFECIATNSSGSSDPRSNLQLSQQLVIVKTKSLQLYLPGDYSYDWGQKYIDPTLRIIESSISAEDIPPSNPSIYDDEFDGATLDTKWSWLFAGAPASGVESYSVGNSKLNVTFGPDSGVAANFGSDAHVLVQTAPNSDFTITIKMSYLSAYTNLYSPIGIFLGADTFDYANGPLLFGVSSFLSGPSTTVRIMYCYDTPSTWVNIQSRRIGGINTYLRVTWDNTLKKVRCWFSGKNLIWMPVTILGPTNCKIGNNLTRFGLVFWRGYSGVADSDREIATVKFFRVTVP